MGRGMFLIPRATTRAMSTGSMCDDSPPGHAQAAHTLLGLEHVPSEGEHIPATWHWSEAVQVTGLLPVHTPLEQVSVLVQALPSLQAVLSGCSKQSRF